MATWDTLCRVCSSPGDYDIFQKIPTEGECEESEEPNSWNKPINIILEETTGLKISQNDELPPKICKVCISYMKHASIFRNQVIKNALSLQMIKQLLEEQSTRSTEDKDNLFTTEQELTTSEQRKVDTNVLSDTLRFNVDQKVAKELFQSGIVVPSKDYIMEQIRYLHLLFNKDSNSDIAKSNGHSKVENRNHHREEIDTELNIDDIPLPKENEIYNEQNFKEDDIMNMEDLRAAIKIPSNQSEERKCVGCFKRITSKESYNEHKEHCIDLKFLSFIEEVNILLKTRRKRSVSANEFVKQMIFSLRKICEFLKFNFDDILQLPESTPTKSNFQDFRIDTRRSKKSRAAAAMTTILSKELDDETATATATSLLTPRHKDYDRSDSLNLAQQLLTLDSSNAKGTATPITIHNNILYEIERLQCRNENNLRTENADFDNVKVMRPIPMHAIPQSHNNHTISPAGSSLEERINFLQKLERAVCPTTPLTDMTTTHTPRTTTPSISVRKDLMPNSNMFPASPSSFSACCNPCNLYFDTLSAFESHNAMYHNNLGRDLEAQREEERNRIIAMFENEDDI